MDREQLIPLSTEGVEYYTNLARGVYPNSSDVITPVELEFLKDIVNNEIYRFNAIMDKYTQFYYNFIIENIINLLEKSNAYNREGAPEGIRRYLINNKKIVEDTTNEIDRKRSLYVDTREIIDIEKATKALEEILNSPKEPVLKDKKDVTYLKKLMPYGIFLSVGLFKRARGSVKVYNVISTVDYIEEFMKAYEGNVGNLTTYGTSTFHQLSIPVEVYQGVTYRWYQVNNFIRALVRYLISSVDIFENTFNKLSSVDEFFGSDSDEPHDYPEKNEKTIQNLGNIGVYMEITEQVPLGQ